MKPLQLLVASFALIGLTLSLRLPGPELAEWKGDEAVQYQLARDVVYDRENGENFLIFRVAIGAIDI